MASVSWGCCTQGQDADSYVECICRRAYHLQCLHSTDRASLEGDSVNDWKCPGCRQRKTRGLNSDNVPVGELASPISTESHPNITSRGAKRLALSTSFEISPETVPMITPEEVRKIVSETFRAEIKELASAITSSIKTSLHDELRSIRNDVLEVKESMNFFNKEYEDLKREHDAGVQKMKSLENDNNDMKATISNLQSRLTQMEQRARLSNVEIQCIPENRNENLSKIILQISKVIDCKLKEESVSQVTRIAKFDRANARPRSIVVEFDNARNRDAFLAASINFNRKNPTNKLNTTHIGITGEKKPIFIAEHLSPANKALHAAARIKAREMKYDFVWVRNGRIFVRKNEGADPILIRDNDCLKKIV